MVTILTDGIFRCIFVNEKFCIWIQISLTFVPKGPTDNNPALNHDLVPNWQQVIVWTNVDLINWYTYAALGGDELMHKGLH